jgi:dipeptidyl aminopeptidase/acylaminoacyl peptidase
MRVRSLLGACLCLALTGIVVAAQPRRAMSIHDLLVAVRIADPQLSPDGRTVAFVRTTTEMPAGRRNADIWVASTTGAEGMSLSKALIAGPSSENTPRWSPDGRTIAFISSRDGEPQVYLADAPNATNIRRLTSVSGGVQPPLVFSPDSSLVAFVADVYPECADDACNRARRDADAKNPVKVHVLTRLLYRHWDEWREGIRHHVFVAPTTGVGPVRDVTPGDFDSPPGQQEDAAIVFTADSKSVAFVSNRDGNDRESWTTNNDVWIAPVAGGSASKLTPNPAADVEPTFTPDGRSLIVRGQRRPGFESDRWYLDVYALRSPGSSDPGSKRTVFESPDLSVNEFTLSPDGQTIYFTASSQGTDNLYRVPFSGGTPQQIVKGGAISAVTAGMSTLVFSKASLTAPAEIFRVPVAGGTLQALTQMNDNWLRSVAMSTPESATVPGAGGTPIQYWIVKPPNFDPSRKYPVVFLIHGGPQGAWGDAWSARWNPSLWAAQGWVVVAPNPRGSTGFGQKFVDEISQDWGGKVMVDLTAVFEAAIKLPYVDAAKQSIAGASYGGYAVNWLIGHTDRFKAAVSHDGVFNLDSMALSTEELWFSEWEAGGVPWSANAREFVAKWSPHLYAQHIRTPTLVITNELDYRVPVDQGLQLFTALRRNNVPARALVFPDEGHWVLKPLNSQRWHDEVFAWLKKYLQ